MSNDPILQPLIDNAEEASVKPIIQNDGSTVLFQREPGLPPQENLDYEVDELENVPEKTYINEEFLDDAENTSTKGLDKEGNPNCLPDTTDLEDESSNHFEEIDGYEEEIPQKLKKKEKQIKNRSNSKTISANSSPKQAPMKKSNSKKSLSPPVAKRLSEIPITPHIEPKKSPLIIPQSSPNNKVNKKSKSRNDLSLIIVISYFILVILILASFTVSHQDQSEGTLRHNKYEQKAVFYLNDCIRRSKNLSIEYFRDQTFIDNIREGKSQYLQLDPTEQFLIIKKPHRTMFCKAVDFGEKHPDYAGLFIIWLVSFVLYINYEVSRIRATKILPDVMKILKEDKMCYIDEAKKRMQERGYFTLGAWWQVKSLINEQENVKTVRILDTKPFWSVESPR